MRVASPARVPAHLVEPDHLLDVVGLEEDEDAGGGAADGAKRPADDASADDADRGAKRARADDA